MSGNSFSSSTPQTPSPLLSMFGLNEIPQPAPSKGGRHFADTPDTPQQPRAVSIGGGTGQPHTIKVLLELGFDVSAVVSMVDDGGSTGILRERANMVPPGDVRKCLSAMATNMDDPFTQAFEQRFGFADNHSLGNLILTALTMKTDSFPEAIDICAQLLKVRGRVLPSTIEHVTLCGKTRDGREFSGETNIGEGHCAIEKVWLEPRAPQAYQPAVDAILNADLVVLGPGSLFTSVISNLVVPGIAQALQSTSATVVFVCSMADMQGETWGLSAEEHVDALLRHGMAGLVDAVLIHRRRLHDIGIATRSFNALTDDQVAQDALLREQDTSLIDHSLLQESHDIHQGVYIRPVQLTDKAIERLEERIPLVLVRDFYDPEHPTWHSQRKLKDVLQGVIPLCRSLQK